MAIIRCPACNHAYDDNPNLYENGVVQCPNCHHKPYVKETSGMGIEAFEKDGNITILPGNPKAAEIETYDDHRVSMSFSLPGLICDGIVIKDPYCCRKTFENYYEVLEKAVY